MELGIKSAALDCRYRVHFSDPQFDLLTHEPRIAFLSKIRNSFGLRLNDIKFNNAAPSNDFIHFSKFIGPAFFNVSFGMEEVEAFIQFAQNYTQILDLFSKFFQLFEQKNISIQRITIQQHFQTESEAKIFLKTLNPNPPNDLQNFLQGTGVYYTLKIDEHDLTIFVTLVDSLFVPGGLYLNMENEFSPNKYEPLKAFEFVLSYYDFILKSLNLKLREA